MLTRDDPPLTMASRVLEPETLKEIKLYKQLNFWGKGILDRWAMNSPELLKKMEKEGGAEMIATRLLIQQELEQDTLHEAQIQGYSYLPEVVAMAPDIRTLLPAYEILQMYGVNSELTYGGYKP